jgi:hypothetical protein
MALPNGVSIETLLLRDPNPEELEILVQQIIALSARTEVLTEECGDLAIVTVNRLPPCVVEPQDYGRELGPILGFARGFVENGVPTKSVAVRVPAADQRAVSFLTSEARQLPIHEPGLVMMDMSSVPGGFRDWEALLLRRLQPAVHTRVSGICLVRWGTCNTDEGAAVIPEVRLIENSHAVIPLPRWLRDQLVSSSGVAVGK